MFPLGALAPSDVLQFISAPKRFAAVKSGWHEGPGQSGERPDAHGKRAGNTFDAVRVPAVLEFRV